MRVDLSNYQQFILSVYDREVDSTVEGTWAKKRNREDIARLPQFYATSFRSGLLEYPLKKVPTVPYGSHRFYPGYFVKEYLKTRILSKQTEALMRKLFFLLSASGIQFPAYTDMHRDFYWNIEGHFFNASLAKYASFLGFIAQHANIQCIQCICEIGGGYGGFAELFLLNRRIRNYIIIDLFETLAVSMSYLLNSHELSEYACVYPESIDEFKQINFQKHNIIFISTGLYRQMNNSSFFPHIDLFVNTNSFVEMPIAVVDGYFDFMQSFFNVYLFSSNSIHRKEGSEIMNAYQFPYDEKWRHLYEATVNHDLFRISSR